MIDLLNELREDLPTRNATLVGQSREAKGNSKGLYRTPTHPGGWFWEKKEKFLILIFAGHFSRPLT